MFSVELSGFFQLTLVEPDSEAVGAFVDDETPQGHRAHGILTVWAQDRADGRLAYRALRACFVDGSLAVGTDAGKGI